MSRRGWTALLLALCIGNTACVTVRYAADHGVVVPEDFLGVCPTIRLEHSELDLIESIGAGWIRQDFPWDTIENRPGEWDFGHWDRYQERAKQGRLEILAILDYDVPWIHDDGGPRPYIPPDKLPCFLAYAARVATRYRDTVAAFEVWNEPNTRRFWKGPRQEFFHLAAETARMVKTSAPQATVVGGAVLGSPAGYLKDMFEAGILNQVDAFSFHPYALHPDGAVRRMDAARSIASRYGFTGELWITEIGYPSLDAPPGSRSEVRQAACAVKILLGAAVRNIRRVFWYELLDPGPAEGRGGCIESSFGLARSDNKPKAAAHACSLVGRFVPGSRYSPDCISIEPSLAGKVEVLPFVKPGGTAALFLWARPRARILLRIDGEVADLREHELYTGEIRPFGRQERLELTRDPRLVSFVCRKGPLLVRVSRARGGAR